MHNTASSLTWQQATRLCADQPIISWAEFVALRVADGRVSAEAGAAWIAGGPRYVGSYAQ